jgi:hypothetical protein
VGCTGRWDRWIFGGVRRVDDSVVMVAAVAAGYRRQAVINTNCIPASGWQSIGLRRIHELEAISKHVSLAIGWR